MGENTMLAILGTMAIGAVLAVLGFSSLLPQVIGALGIVVVIAGVAALVIKILK